jgi:environmental stress-induced protein Ves
MRSTTWTTRRRTTRTRTTRSGCLYALRVLQIIRRSSFTAAPWKNGGGVTHEIIRVPAGEAGFRWRLSVAQVEESGPFSDFAGYDRTLVLLRGAGVRLRIAGRDPVSLSLVGTMVQFDGSLKTDCQLLGGPCMDLNLMVSRAIHEVTTRVETVAERRAVPLPNSGQGIALVFSIAGALTVDAAGQALVRLNPWDLAIVPAGDGAMVAGDASPDAARPDASALVFFATLDDNLPSIPPR